MAEKYESEMAFAFGFQDAAQKNTSVRAYSSLEYTDFSNKSFAI